MKKKTLALVLALTLLVAGVVGGTLEIGRAHV